jgi:hypothetical protein
MPELNDKLHTIIPLGEITPPPNYILCTHYGGCGARSESSLLECLGCKRKLWTIRNYFDEKFYLGQQVYFERSLGIAADFCLNIYVFYCVTYSICSLKVNTGKAKLYS